MIFLRPLNKVNKKYKTADWDKAAEWWNKTAGDDGTYHQQIDIDPVLFKVLGSVRNKTILEIGCGNGYLARKLAKKGARVTAVDLSKKLLQYALERERQCPLGIKYLLRNSAKLSGIGSRFFDVCVANMCFMDIADVQNTMKEAARTLKNKGHFIFSITHPMADLLQPWITIKNRGKKYFARAVCAYMSERKYKFVFSESGLALTHYHRSIGDYLRCLREAGLWLNRFVEIITKKEISKVVGQEIVASETRAKYKDLADKKRKEFATKEIPLFLLAEAIKL